MNTTVSIPFLFKDVGSNTILQDIARARENIQKSLAGVSTCSVHDPSLIPPLQHFKTRVTWCGHLYSFLKTNFCPCVYFMFAERDCLCHHCLQRFDKLSERIFFFIAGKQSKLVMWCTLNYMSKAVTLFPANTKPTVFFHVLYVSDGFVDLS